MDACHDMLVEHLPHLRAYAFRLSHNGSMADDLVQDTMLRALCNIDKYMPGTNMRAWLSTILRNQFYDEMRSRSRFAAYVALPHPTRHAGEQEAHLQVKDFEKEFAALPAMQREALSLIGLSGFSYQEAAELVCCPPGTIKSRVWRARATLARQLGDEATAAHPVRIAANEDFPLAA